MTTDAIITLSPDEAAEARRALAAIQAAPHLVRGGIAELLRDWQLAVAQCEQGYRGCLEAYRQDLSGRELIHRVQSQVSQPLAARIAAAVEPLDRRMRALLVGDECACDAEEQRARQFSPAVEWWYFGFPRTGRPE
jgi:hypothetical protein